MEQRLQGRLVLGSARAPACPTQGSFRESPLFAILEDYICTEDEQIQGFLREIAGQFLELHRKVPEKFRLEVRGAAQHFFRKWAEANSGSAEADQWKKVLESLEV